MPILPHPGHPNSTRRCSGGADRAGFVDRSVERRTGPGRAVAWPVGISGLHRFETRLVQAQSVAWATDTQIAILGGDAQSTLQTYLISIDGSAVTVLGGVPGISSIAATAQHPTLAGTLCGVVWADSGSGWRKVLVATWPGYPG